MNTDEKIYWAVMAILVLIVAGASYIAYTTPDPAYNMGDCKYMIVADQGATASWIMGEDPNITTMEPVQNGKYWCIK